MSEDFAGLCEKVNNFSIDGIFASDMVSFSQVLNPQSRHQTSDHPHQLKYRTNNSLQPATYAFYELS